MGDLARKLRLLGIDAAYMGGVPDEVLIRVALETGRTILSRDESLCAKAASAGVRAVCAGDLASALSALGVRRVLFNPELARCPHCGTPVTRVEDVELVRGEVPEGVLRSRRAFYVCMACGRVYWVGGHWKNIKRMERELNASLSNVRGLQP